MVAPPSPTSPTPLLVACFCAQWCTSCRDYRRVFDELAAMHPALRFLWIDIEDEADLVDPIEVENFPTLLIASQGEPRFFGPLLPHRETLQRLLRAQLEAPGPPVADLALHALVRRLATHEPPA